MDHLNYVILLAGMILTIVAVAFYIFPDVICGSVLSNFDKNGGVVPPTTDPVLQVCLVEKGR